MDTLNREDAEKRARFEAASVEAVAYLRASGCPFPVGAKPGVVASNWLVAFADMTEDLFGIAVGMHVQSERAQFWPTPFELRSYVAPPAEDWAALFGQLMKQIAQGKAGAPAHPSPVVAETVRQWMISEGGSSVLGQMESKDRPHRQRAFVEYMTKAARDAEISARRDRVVGGGLKLIGAAP